LFSVISSASEAKSQVGSVSDEPSAHQVRRPSRCLYLDGGPGTAATLNALQTALSHEPLDCSVTQGPARPFRAVYERPRFRLLAERGGAQQPESVSLVAPWDVKVAVRALDTTPLKPSADPVRLSVVDRLTRHGAHEQPGATEATGRSLPPPNPDKSPGQARFSCSACPAEGSNLRAAEPFEDSLARLAVLPLLPVDSGSNGSTHHSRTVLNRPQELSTTNPDLRRLANPQVRA
jgi:hypothetical protein